MSDEECGACRFWRRDGDGRVGGHCRRYPPFSPVGWRIYSDNREPYKAVEIESARFLNDAWPNTSSDAWCGEFRPSPERP